MTIDRIYLAAAIILTLNASMGAAGAATDDAKARQVQPTSPRRAAALLEKLTTGRPTRIVALGDSLTYGMELAAPSRDTFVEVFAEALRSRFNNPHIALLRRGVPGETAHQALRRLDRDVLWAEPDLVIVQYGGNDFQAGTSPEQYEQDLVAIGRRIIEETGGCLILCAHPMAEPTTFNSPFVAAAKHAAEALGCSVADLDSAVRRGNLGPRGPFPHYRHPGAYVHAVMARELYAAFDRLVGVKPKLRVQIAEEDGSCEPDSTITVVLKLTNLTENPVQGRWHIIADTFPLGGHFRLAPNAEQRIQVPIPTPAMFRGARSTQYRLFATVQSADYGTYDLKWLTFAPAIRPRKLSFAPPKTHENKLVWSNFIGPGGLTLGQDRWQGPWDLSASFAVRWTDREMTTEVRVIDDDVSPGSPQNPPEGDSVEFYLDLRPSSSEGRPVYDENVLIIRVLAPGPEPGPAVWSTLDEAPADIGELALLSRRDNGGYRVRLGVPNGFITRRAGADIVGIGLDVGVNDADHGGQRKTQIMWCGTADNWLDPSRFGYLLRDGQAGELHWTIR